MREMRETEQECGESVRIYKESRWKCAKWAESVWRCRKSWWKFCFSYIKCFFFLPEPGFS